MNLTRILLCLSFAILAGCGRFKMGPQSDDSSASGQSLVEARTGFKTRLIRSSQVKQPLDQPPANMFRTVKYESPVGKLAAYLTPDPKDGEKHPAIVWITGGDCNSIGDVWSEAPAKNDQTAAQYRQAGIVMMFPSLRGGNQNPGQREGFFGEVDDVLAATDYLIKQPYVDPDRIYLGGHSTGGTLALLVAECSNRYRAVFSFGPVDDVAGYGDDNVWTPFDFSNPKELELRAPGRWLAHIASPTFVFEGTRKGNVESLNAMSRSSTNANVTFFPVEGADHFSLLAPVNRFLAARILKDDGPRCNLSFTTDDINGLMRR